MIKLLTIRLLAATLTFIIGVSINTVWEKRQRIIDACTEFLMDYQD